MYLDQGSFLVCILALQLVILIQLCILVQLLLTLHFDLVLFLLQNNYNSRMGCMFTLLSITVTTEMWNGMSVYITLALYY